MSRRTNWISTERIDRAIAVGTPGNECAKFLDSFQAEAFEHLAERYKDETFAKLLALKLTNLAAGRYHLVNRHSVLFSHPVLLMVDPANDCQLGCPSCVHTTNTSFGAVFDWPRTTLPVHTYEAFLERFGPFAFGAALYNYGEPLLNKHFDKIVRASKEYLLNAITSTNLSMPLANAEAIVDSGLDYMVLSIDGATQAVYERYRRKGDLVLVLENVRKLVAAKKALGSSTPYLVWQFLTFEHNHHELPEAMRLAKALGVNEISVATPFAVDSDDPTIRPVKSPKEGFYRLHAPGGQSLSRARNQGMANRSEAIERAFGKSWESRFLETGPNSTATRDGTCSWLYFNMTMDGAARIMPCYMAPDKVERKLVFSNFGPDETTDALAIVNSPMATLARESFASPESYEKNACLRSREQLPYCAKCEEKTSPPYSFRNVRHDIHSLDFKRVISEELASKLTAW